MPRLGARVALACALLVLGGRGGPARADEKASLPGIEKEFKEAVANVTPATVICRAVAAKADEGSSGILVSKRGLVLSDSDASMVYVISGEGETRRRERTWVEDVEVRVPDSNGTYRAYKAKVVKRVAEADTMLLRITNPPANGFSKWVTLGSSDDLHVGDFAFAVGYSFDLSAEALPSLTAGIVSSLVPFPEGHAEGRWQTLYASAAVNPGVNGGPLVDLEGRLIGTVSTWGNPDPDDPYQFLSKVIPTQRLRHHYGSLPEAAELFPEVKPQKERSAQAAALESTFHAAGESAYRSVASLVVARSDAWQPQWGVPQGKKVPLAHFAGPRSALAVSPRGEFVTSLYNLTNVFSLQEPPRPGEPLDPELALEPGLATIIGIKVCLPDGRTFPARIVGIDPRLSIALLQAEMAAGEYAVPVLAPAAPDTLKEGRFALAVGNPFGTKPLPSPLLTAGILSKVHAWHAAAPWRGNWQTDAPVTDANCGGALVGLKGDLVGMLQIWDPLQHGRASGIGFVVPWALIEEALPALRAGKVWKRGRLGVSSSPQRSPPLLEEVVPGSAADRAGLKAGDVLLTIDGRAPRNGLDAIESLRYRWGGEKVRFTVERSGEKKPLELEAVLDER